MFGLPPLFAHLAELITITLLTAIATGAGLAWLRILRVSPLLSTGERLLFASLLGYGTMSMLTFGIGLLGLLHVRVALAMLLVLAAVGARPLFATLRQAAPAMRGAIRSLRYPPNLFLALVIVAVVGATLVKALVPVATQDDLMYHLALPRRYIEDGRVTFYPDSNYSLFPQLMEMLYTLSLLLGSDRLAVLFAYSTALFAAAAAALFAKRLLGDSTGTGIQRSLPLLVAAVFLTSPLTGFVMRAANTDFAQATADMLAIYAFYLAVKSSPTPNLPLLALSGICGGLAFSVKYYGIAVPGALGLALLAILLANLRKAAPQERRLFLRAAANSTVVYALPIAAIAAVWLLRNFISSGNPVWPAAGKLLGGSYWSPAADPEVLLGTIPGLSLTSLWSGLQYDLNAIIRPEQPLDNHRYIISLGPLIITALLALPFARWKPALRLVFYVAALIWVISLFYFSRASIRYLESVFLFCALMGAYALVSVAARSRLARMTLGVAVSLTLTLLALDTVLSTGPFLPTTFALDPAAESRYLAAHMDDDPVMRYIADKTPPNATIYVWDSRPRGYRIPRLYVYGRLVPAYSGVSPNPDEWHARLKQLGVTYVLIHSRLVFAPSYPPGFDPDRQTLQAIASKYFDPAVLKAGDYQLYPLR